MRISVEADLKQLKSRLTRLQKEQLPFAASMAINQVAADVATEITRQMPRILDRPTPFTLKAYQMRPGTFRGYRANKRNLSALINPAEIQKQYLRFQIEGGTRTPNQSKIFVPSNKAPKNQYGNVPRGRRSQIIAGKGKYFTMGQKEGRTPGVYLRTPTGVEPMAFYVQDAKYKAILPVKQIAAGVVKSKFRRRLEESLRKAIATAR